MTKKVVLLKFSVGQLPDKSFHYRDYGSEIISLLTLKSQNDPVGYVMKSIKPLGNIEFKPKDKIAFLPSCTVPRVKLKSFTTDNKIAVTRDFNKADYVFYSENSIAENIESIWAFSVNTQSIKDLYESLPDKLKKIGFVEVFENLLSQAEYTDKVLLDYSARRSMQELCSLIGVDENKFFNAKGLEGYTKRFNCIKSDLLANFLNSENQNKLVHQDFLLGKLNDQNILTEEVYESIKQLIESKQDSDITVAMEIMANCDFEKSAFYNLMLLKSYYRDVFFYNKARNHVNFKSLLNYYNVGKYTHITYDSIIFWLKKKNILYKSVYDKIAVLYKKQFENNVEHMGLEHLGLKEDFFFLNVDYDLVPEMELEPEPEELDNV